MKRAGPTDADAMARRLASVDAATIDELYGLEPVFEPEAVPARGGPATELVAITCPYCWESLQILVDLTGGSGTYVEDCQVCCQPIELVLDVSAAGTLLSILPNRMD